MRQNLKTLQACIDTIRNEQDFDGGFKHAKYKTTYITGLILQSLSICKEKRVQKKISKISNKCMEFLLGEKNDRWTWNYFSKETQEQFPALQYPNDNDDTFIVLSALLLKDKDIFTGEVLAIIVKNLIDSESQPGGPYHTWLTKTEDKEWQDIDVAVNANIAYFLHLQGIHLSNLDTFLLKKLENDLRSPYYPTELPLLYFLSKSDLSNEDLLIKRIRIFQEQNKEDTLMINALCLSSLIRLGGDSNETKNLRNKIIEQIEKDGIQSEPFCIDPQINGNAYFCGSKSLTAGFVIEALSLYEDSIPHSKRWRQMQKIIKKVEDVFPRHLIRKTMGNLKKEFILYPFVLIHELSTVSTKQIRKTTTQIAYLNLLGWVAYKIIDDIIDEHTCQEYLPSVNIALREIDITYMEIFKNKDYQELYKKVMDTMDTAQKEEVGEILNEKIMLKRLGEKSIGHALPTIALLSLLKEKASSGAVQSIISFWKNYLTAKQLSDDAHDWKEDNKNGVPNSTLFFIRQSKYYQKEKDDDLTHLEEIFWNETIITVTEKMQYYATICLWNIKEHRCFRNTNFFLDLVLKLQKDTDNVLKERKEIMNFYEQIN